MAPLSEDRLLICGGYSGAFQSNVFVVDLGTESLERAFIDSSLKVWSQINQATDSTPGQVVGLALDEKYKVQMVKYSQGDDRLTRVETLGYFY